MIVPFGDIVASRPCTHEGLKNGKTYCWRDLSWQARLFRKCNPLMRPYTHEGVQDKQYFHVSVTVRLMRSIVATPTL